MDFLRSLLAVVDGDVGRRIVRRREHPGGTQIPTGASQPVADEFQRGFI